MDGKVNTSGMDEDRSWTSTRFTYYPFPILREARRNDSRIQKQKQNG